MTAVLVHKHMCMDVIEHDVSGPKLPPKPQPYVGEIKHLPANECEETTDVLPLTLSPKCKD